MGSRDRAGLWAAEEKSVGFPAFSHQQIVVLDLVDAAALRAFGFSIDSARELEMQGRSIVSAAIEASRLRLRPILMTSLSYR
jgi:hypothetical protein